MKSFHLLALALSAFLPLSAQQCGPSPAGGARAGAGAGALDGARLQRTWLHAHEEDHGDTLVFRPNTYTFRPSRGRTGFQVEPDGALTQLDIAPTDGLESHKGRWRLEGRTLIATFPDGASQPYRLQVLQLEADKLVAIRTFDR